MSNKQAVELSLNFIVILIISIALFGFGVIFIRNLFSQANDLRDLTLNELDERIGELICEGSDRVCIGMDSETVKRKEYYVFGLRILNVLDSQNFDIEVSPVEDSSGVIVIKKNGEETRSPHRLLIYPQSRQGIFIKQNEEVKLGIGIQVPSNAVSGTYIFNVNIKDGEGNSYLSSVQKLYVEVP